MSHIGQRVRIIIKFFFILHPIFVVRSFFQLVGDLNELKEKVYTDLIDKPKGKDSKELIAQPSVECLDIELDDLEVVATLGIGGFGRVELVKVRTVSYLIASFEFLFSAEAVHQAHLP